MPDPKDNKNNANEFDNNLDTLRFDSDELNVSAQEGEAKDKHNEVGNSAEHDAKFIGFEPIGGYEKELTPEESEKLILNELRDHMDYALDQDGKLYSDCESFMNVLRSAPEDKVFYISDGMKMWGVKNDEGVFQITEDAVTPQTQLKEKWRNEPYEAKTSLKLSEIAKPTDYTYINAEIKHKKKTAEAIKKNPQAYINSAKKDAEKFEKEGYETIRRDYAFRRGVDEDIFAKKPKQPVRPRLGTGNTLWRWVVKAISFGQAETDAYKKYTKKKQQYLKDEKAFQHIYKKFNARYNENNKFAEEKKLIDDEFNKQLKAKKDAIQKAETRVKGIDAEITRYKRMDSQNVSNYQANTRCVSDINSYHEKTEVRLQGVLDLQEKGKITKDNLFANNWLLRGSVLGKKGTELNDEDIRNIAKYIASEAVEKKMMQEYVENPKYDNVAGAEIAALNDGSAEEAILNSEEFKSTIAKAKTMDEPIDPDDIEMEFKELRLKKLVHESPASVLEAEKQRMIENFGKKHIDNVEEVALEIARYKALNEKIREFKRTRYNGPEDKNWKTDMGEARRIAGDMHVDPFQKVEKYSLDSKKRYTEIVSLGADVREQYEKVKPAVENIRNRFNESQSVLNSIMKEHEKNEYSAVKLGFEKLKGSAGYTLEEIVDFVDNELGLDKAPEQPMKQNIL